MKNTIIAAVLAAMTFAAVSCSDKKEDKPSETENTTASEAVSTEDVTDEAATEEETEDELTKHLREKLEENIERCVDITLQELPKYDIPTDWKEINNGTLKMLVPPEVSETEKEKTDSVSVENEYQNEDNSVHIIFHYLDEWDEGWVYHPSYPDLTGEDVKAAFSELGVDYDGSRASFLKAISSFTSDDKTAENEKAFRIASIEKGIELGYYGSLFHNLSDGHDVYIEGGFGEYMNEDEMRVAYALIFADSNKEYSVRVEAPTKEELLMICSTLSFS
ncbi:MAG: hypothetical protein K6G33_07170 [Ruminococcus sp.]|uniref:hypothetical protein n=1 Tax=Ruminococcus sp. TaxID=41978 RepID=UPI0025D663E6|nr:hypothetical protein [Ruminococcus sp.]MCR5600502.1 hypothetical protein [Ruminococcus sp.]